MGWPSQENSTLHYFILGDGEGDGKGAELSASYTSTKELLLKTRSIAGKINSSGKSV